MRKSKIQKRVMVSKSSFASYDFHRSVQGLGIEIKIGKVLPATAKHLDDDTIQFMVREIALLAMHVEGIETDHQLLVIKQTHNKVGLIHFYQFSCKLSPALGAMAIEQVQGKVNSQPSGTSPGMPETTNPYVDGSNEPQTEQMEPSTQLKKRKSALKARSTTSQVVESTTKTE